MEPFTPSPWKDILIDSFDDLVASKRVALVERGAPRDFLDIYQICRKALATPLQCWQLWGRRQELARSDTDLDRARLAILTHMVRIEQHRPLENISLYPDREALEQLTTLEECIDFLARLCSAWDFGVLPEQKTVDKIRRPEWREAVDHCRLLTSPTYHLLREWHNLKRLPYLGQQIAYIREDPYLERI